MARGLKSVGLAEIEAVRARVKRQATLKRIWQTDADELLDLLDRFEAKVIAMEEVERGTL